MSKLISIPATQAQMIGLIHQGLSAAREYARNLSSDVELHPKIRPFFTDQASSISILLNRMDGKISKSIYEAYKEQVIDADALALDNLKQLFIRMLPAQRQMLEQAAEAILKNEFSIELEKPIDQ